MYDWMDPQRIMTEPEYDKAMIRVYQLMDAKPGTPEGKELEALLPYVVAYEEENFPMI